MENTEFVRQHLSDGLGPELRSNLGLVDFDAFGSPTDAMKEFFGHYDVKRPLLLTITDGAHLFVKRHSGTDYGRNWVRRHYLVNRYPGTQAKHLETLDGFVNELGKRKGFTAERINAAHSHHAIYAGYRLRPSRP